MKNLFSKVFNIGIVFNVPLSLSLSKGSSKRKMDYLQSTEQLTCLFQPWCCFSHTEHADISNTEASLYCQPLSCPIWFTRAPGGQQVN